MLVGGGGLRTQIKAMVHCVPVWKDICAGYESPCDWEHLVASGALPPTKLKQMVGKGWHIQAMGSFVMYMLASVECRQEVILQHPVEWFFEPADPWDEETGSGGTASSQEFSDDTSTSQAASGSEFTRLLNGASEDSLWDASASSALGSSA